MNDEHSFNIEVAKVVGVNAAILIKSIRWWCLKNKANEKHYHDGLYWTYNTIGAFCDLYPYLGKSAISRALKKLEDGGYIRTGNFNKTPYDRTRWYAITQAGTDLCEGSVHFPKREMEETESENQIEQSVPPIPAAKQLLFSSDEERKKKAASPTETYDSIIDGFTKDQELRDALRGFLQYRVATAHRQKKEFTNHALKLNLTKLRKLSSDPRTMTAIVNQTVEKGWSGFFELKDGTHSKPQRQIDISEYSEPKVGSKRYDNTTGITEVYRGNGIWEKVSEYIGDEEDDDIEF